MYRYYFKVSTVVDGEQCVTSCNLQPIRRILIHLYGIEWFARLSRVCFWHYQPTRKSTVLYPSPANTNQNPIGAIIAHTVRKYILRPQNKLVIKLETSLLRESKVTLKKIFSKLTCY